MKAKRNESLLVIGLSSLTFIIGYILGMLLGNLIAGIIAMVVGLILIIYISNAKGV